MRIKKIKERAQLTNKKSNDNKHKEVSPTPPPIEQIANLPNGDEPNNVDNTNTNNKTIKDNDVDTTKVINANLSNPIMFNTNPTANMYNH